jgi:hypothetical protein
LGNHVTHNYGTTANSVCQGNDSRLLTTVEQTFSGTKVFSGTHGTSPTLSISGAGSRMFFYPRKSAFRAGYVSGTRWDDANIGEWSIAMGHDPRATGDSSIAIGSSANATGGGSIAIGGLAFASGENATALGGSNVASGHGSTALGRVARAVGNYAFAVNLSLTQGPDVGANEFRISNATTIGGNLTWTNHSDIRLKTDIKQIYNPLQKVLNLNGVRFTYKDIPEKYTLGFIAQEVQRVCPELVEYDELNDIYSIKESSFTAVIVEAIKEQNNLINNLQNRIKILEEKGE